MKKIVLVFKSGVKQEVIYSSKMYDEITENLGKDHKAEAKSYSVNCKELVGAFYEVEEVKEAKEA